MVLKNLNLPTSVGSWIKEVTSSLIFFWLQKWILSHEIIFVSWRCLMCPTICQPCPNFTMLIPVCMNMGKYPPSHVKRSPQVIKNVCWSRTQFISYPTLQEWLQIPSQSLKQTMVQLRPWPCSLTAWHILDVLLHKSPPSYSLIVPLDVQQLQASISVFQARWVIMTS
jgi:hypothetical protein